MTDDSEEKEKKKQIKVPTDFEPSHNEATTFHNRKWPKVTKAK